MWQLFVLLSLLFTSFENIIDKKAILKNNDIDNYISTFIRIFFYIIVIYIINLIITGEFIKITYHIGLIFFGIVSAGTGLLYTYLLKKIQITSIGIFSYLGPLLFLVIDNYYLNLSLTHLQLIGIFLILLGGFGFSLDRKNFKLKKELTWKVLAVFLIYFIYAAIEIYYFKYMVKSENMNGATFFFNIWLVSAILLLSIIIFTRKANLLLTIDSYQYGKNTILSKSCDAAKSLLIAEALVLTSASQVSTMETLLPIVLLITTIITQKLLGINLDEQLDNKNLIWKIINISILVTGAIILK